MRENPITPARSGYRAAQRGVSLVIVMIVLTIVSLLGVAGIQISTLSERGARNEVIRYGSFYERNSMALPIFLRPDQAPRKGV